ncbi:glycosyltransferase [Haloarcula laminariae]|uniref:glycosyltransferase n=1 Tax=Haloarcula laminariae TaxID=2961577 RepID=UPI0021C76992|nr:glycosyltransferase [Halomicroarcula laminariae]
MVSLRVCFVVNAVDQTVAEVDIAVALQRYTDTEVTVLSWFDAVPFYRDELVDVVNLDAPDTTTGVNRETLRQASEVIAEADIVQTTHNHSGVFAKLLSKYNGVPSVSREGNTRDGFTRLGRVSNGLTNPISARVVCNSRAVWESFKRWETALLNPGNVVIIPNGVDRAAIDAAAENDWSVHQVADIGADTILVGTVSTLTEQKNHETLVRGVALAREQGVPVELVVAGDGPQRDRLEALASDLGVVSKVHFLGDIERAQVYGLLHEIDIYAMPSLWEGFSMAAVEAVASGTACVFADIEPFRQTYDEVAKFHEPTDAETLADELGELASDPDERERLGATGRQLVAENYTIEAIARSYRSVYEAVLAESNG